MNGVTLTLVDLNHHMVNAWAHVFDGIHGVEVVHGSLLDEQVDAEGFRYIDTFERDRHGVLAFDCQSLVLQSCMKQAFVCAFEHAGSEFTMEEIGFVHGDACEFVDARHF